jgi:hypothetical protein
MTANFTDRRIAVPRLAVPQGADAKLQQFAKTVQDAHASLVEQHNRRDDDLRQALRGGISAANSDNVKYKTLRVAIPEDPPFINLTLVAPWANYGAGFYSAGVLMEPGGHVSTRGLVTGGVPNYVTGLMTTLGAGYAPGQEIGFASEGGNGAYALGRVHTDGGIYFAFSAAVDPYIFLEPFRWVAPNAARPHPFTGGNWPVVVQHDLDRCTVLDVVGCRPASDVSGTAGAPIVDWEDIGGGKIRINGVWGLQWGTVYNLRLRLSQEEDT